jgi:hypothetical protein
MLVTMKRIEIRFIQAALLLLLVACKKPTATIVPQSSGISAAPEKGLPANYKSVNGFFYANYHYNRDSWFTNQVAVFSDPARNLAANLDHTYEYYYVYPATSGNVDVGKLTFNEYMVGRQSNNNAVWFSGNNESTNLEATWTIEGNGSFKAFTITVPRGYPEIKVTQIDSNIVIKKSEGFVMDLKNKIVNFDSVVVVLRYGSTEIRKAQKSDATPVVFSVSELKRFGSTMWATLTICVFNYSSQVYQSKNYLFELSRKLTRTIQIIE